MIITVLNIIITVLNIIMTVLEDLHHLPEYSSKTLNPVTAEPLSLGGSHVNRMELIVLSATIGASGVRGGAEVVEKE